MKTLIAIILNLNCFLVVSAGVLPATINNNMVLDIKGSPYQLNGNVTIAKGVTLTVNPGVMIQSTGNFGILINGQIIMEGKKDSLIKADSIYIQFNPGSIGYNPISATGSRFAFVAFHCANNGNGTAIRSNKASIFIRNCVFHNVNYALYANSDSVNIVVNNSKIMGKTNGYSIYNSYKNWTLTLFEDTIVNGGYLYMATHNKIEKCLFLGGTNTYYGLYGQTHTKTATISCNYFNRIYYGINLSSLSANHGIIKIHNNVIDSAYYGAFFSRDFNSDSVSVDNNAFLKCDYALYCLTGINPNPYKIFSCKNNWWGTTDTNKIKAAIYDHNDNSMIIPKVSVIPILNNPPALCGPSHGNYGTADIKIQYPVDVKIGPNPAKDYLLVTSAISQTVNCQIHDLQGRLVYDGILELPGTINTSKLSGNYILTFSKLGFPYYREKLLIIK